MAAKYPKHAAVVAWCHGEVKAGVREVPLGSNTGPRVRWYQSHTWLPGTGWPWCTGFALTGWEEAGGFRLPWPSAGAWDLANRARAAGWAVASPGALVPGDIVTFKSGAGHLAVFLKYDGKTDTIFTVDGNVSDRVDYRERSRSLVRDLIHVPEKPVILPVPVKVPMFQVVTSEGGERVVYVSGANAIAKRLPRFLRRHGNITIRRKQGVSDRRP